MSVTKRQQYEACVQIIKAMAHPTRLLLVDELSRYRERCVCELTDLIGADVSTVSRHLQMLKDAGIIMDEKRGNLVFYRLQRRQIHGVLQFAECCLRNRGTL